MKIPRKIAVTVLVLGLAGLALFITLLVRHNAGAIAEAVAAAGWGLAAVILFHCIPLLFDVLSWRSLIPDQHRPRFPQLYLMRWIGDSVSSMLPVAQVGGEIVRVRMATQRGIPLPVAAASVLVGMTVSVATQIVFLLSGLALLLIETGHDGLTRPVLAAAGLGVAAVAGFYAVQRVGMFRMIAWLVSRIAREDAWKGLVQQGEALDADVRLLYGRRRALLACCCWTMLNWLAGACEVWIALWALGLHASFAQAYVLESMSQGIRSVMFLVPGALGVQEGGYLVVGKLLGISSQNALALAVIRRVRELAFGVPGVIVWQWLEGRRLWHRRPQAALAAGGAIGTPLPKAP